MLHCAKPAGIVLYTRVLLLVALLRVAHGWTCLHLPPVLNGHGGQGGPV